MRDTLPLALKLHKAILNRDSTALVNKVLNEEPWTNFRVIRDKRNNNGFISNCKVKAEYVRHYTKLLEDCKGQRNSLEYKFKDRK